MFDFDKWQEIFAMLRKNKLRTFLTACGVFWGIFMLLIMLGFGNGLEGGVLRSMSGFATNSVYIWGQRTTIPFAGLRPGRNIGFDNDDVAAIRAEVEGIEYFAPRNQIGGHRGGSTVTHSGKSSSFSVMGDYPDSQKIQPMIVTHGRMLNDLDIAERRKICVIGARVYETLFERGEEPIGAEVSINGVYFEVVGVAKSQQSGDRAERQSGAVFIPFTTFQQAFNFGDSVGWLSVSAKPGVPIKTVEDRIRGLMAERHKISPSDEQAIGSWNAHKEFAKLQSLFIGIKAFIWFVGVITLLAGVIGVSNIMLIVVKERTKEIGVRKALGATPLSIVSLVLQEAVVLTALSGYAGVVAGVGVLEAFGAWLDANGGGGEMFARPEVDFRVTIIATLILIGAGAVAGIIPARHAAKIEPVEALRAE